MEQFVSMCRHAGRRGARKFHQLLGLPSHQMQLMMQSKDSFEFLSSLHQLQHQCNINCHLFGLSTHRLQHQRRAKRRRKGGKPCWLSAWCSCLLLRGRRRASNTAEA